VYFVRFVLFCTDTVNDFLAKNCPFLAAAIAFYVLFSLFPLFLAIISVAGFVLGPHADKAELARDISEVIPVSAEYIGRTVEGIVSARAITGVASIIGLLWASTAAFGAMRKGINASWGIKKTRPFLRERAMDFMLVIGAGLLILSLLFGTPILESIRELSAVIAPESDAPVAYLWSLIARLTTPVLTFATFVLLYRFLPNTKVTFSDVWMGALLAALAFDGAMWGFVWYVRTFPVYNAVYGSVGAVMALLTWVYVSAIILLFGAHVTSRYAQYTARVQDVRGIRIVWTGLSRVRLRVVAAEAG
jgi:membrane protein